MGRRCTGCGLERDPEQDFYWKDAKRGLRQSRCKYCQLQKSRQHYKRHRHEYMSRANRYEMVALERHRRRLVEYFSSHLCVDCGCTDIRLLEFDHVHGKKSGNSSRMIRLGFS